MEILKRFERIFIGGIERGLSELQKREKIDMGITVSSLITLSVEAATSIKPYSSETLSLMAATSALGVIGAGLFNLRNRQIQRIMNSNKAIPIQ